MDPGFSLPISAPDPEVALRLAERAVLFTADSVGLGAALRQRWIGQDRGPGVSPRVRALAAALYLEALPRAVTRGETAPPGKLVNGLPSNEVAAASVAQGAWWGPARRLFRISPEDLPLNDRVWGVRWDKESPDQPRLTGHSVVIEKVDGGVQTHTGVVRGDLALVSAEFEDVRGAEFKVGIGSLRFCFRTEYTQHPSMVGSYLDVEVDGELRWGDGQTLGPGFRIQQRAKGKVFAAVLGEFLVAGIEMHEREWWSWARPNWSPARRPPDRSVPVIIETHEAMARCTGVRVYRPWGI